MSTLVTYTKHFVNGLLEGLAFDDGIIVPDDIAEERVRRVMNHSTPDNPIRAIGGSDYYVTDIQMKPVGRAA